MIIWKELIRRSRFAMRESRILDRPSRSGPLLFTDPANVIKAEDMTICHMGDYGQDKFEEHQLEEMGDVDILMIPVGGVYTIDYKEAVDIVRQIEPKIIIP